MLFWRKKRDFRLIVGIGNPGALYRGNRHNIGFMCVNDIARRHSISLTMKQSEARTGEGSIGGIKVLLSPDITNQLFERLAEGIDTMVSNGQQPAVITAPNVRPALRRLTETTFPSLGLLSYNEIVPGVEVFSVGTVSLDSIEADQEAGVDVSVSAN